MRFPFYLLLVAALSPVCKLLCDLIAIPSVNPAFLPGADPRAGEGAMAEKVADLARKGGLEVTFQNVAPGRKNVIARLTPSARPQQRILLAPHLDTVGEPSLDTLLKPQVQGKRIVGRGACDTKGCVAAMLSAVIHVAQSGVRPRTTEIIWVGLVDEENGQAGSRHYAASGAGGDFAIVGEPTRLKVVTAHKGDVWLEICVRGKSAHGSTPWLGKNAVRDAGRLVEALESDYARQLLARKHPLLGTGTINVGSIRGGTQPNIVPNECRIWIDRRTLPGEDEAQVRREIQAIAKAVGVRIEFVPLRTAPCPALETNPEHARVRDLCAVSGNRETIGVHYFCDAAPLAAAGIPSIVFGPGDIAQAHTNNEWISVQSLERGTRILERFLRGLA